MRLLMPVSRRSKVDWPAGRVRRRRSMRAKQRDRLDARRAGRQLHRAAGGGEAKRAILKPSQEHSAEYQSRRRSTCADSEDDFEAIDNIVIQTSHHTHYVTAPGPAIRRR